MGQSRQLLLVFLRCKNTRQILKFCSQNDKENLAQLCQLFVLLYKIGHDCTTKLHRRSPKTI